VADELAEVLAVADRAVVATDGLVQPGRVEVDAAQVPEAIDHMAGIDGEAADAPEACCGGELDGEVGAANRSTSCI
jgi:ABC-type sugar transport system ATPase subunit